MADVAAMLAAAAGNPAAVRQHYNSCSDRTVTLVGVAKTLMAALGKEVQIVLYDEKAVDIPKGKGFPFRCAWAGQVLPVRVHASVHKVTSELRRSVHFFASTDKAKRELGWKPAHTFVGDAAELVECYKASGRGEREMSFEADDLILQSV